jgi:hypothetical protein
MLSISPIPFDRIGALSWEFLTITDTMVDRRLSRDLPCFEIQGNRHVEGAADEVV